MFKFMSSFTFKEKQYWLYRRATHLYYSKVDLGTEVEASESLRPIPEDTDLSQFVSTL